MADLGSIRDSVQPLSADMLNRMDAWCRAANYLSVGQIYLMANPLLREPPNKNHIKPRLLGHWGTTPGLNFIYVHMNRLINERDLNAIYITGPGRISATMRSMCRNRATPNWNQHASRGSSCAMYSG